MRSLRSFVLALLVALLAPLVAAAGTALPWMPTDAGWRWGFEGPLGARDSSVSRGLDDFDGVQAIRIEHMIGADAGLQQYWIDSGSADAGSLLFAGFFRTGENTGVRYEPPMRFMRGPAVVGDNWIVTTTPISLPDGLAGGPITLEFRVMEVIEPGLVGEAFGVSYVVPLLGGARALPGGFTVLGRRITGDATMTGLPPEEPLDWFAAGFGQVRYRRGGDLFVLTSVDAPVPARSSTWGRIKRLYR